MQPYELPEWVPSEIRGALRDEIKRTPSVAFLLKLLDGESIRQREWLQNDVGTVARRAQVWEQDCAIDHRTGARCLDTFKDEPIDRELALRRLLEYQEALRRDWEEPIAKLGERGEC